MYGCASLTHDCKNTIDGGVINRVERDVMRAGFEAVVLAVLAGVTRRSKVDPKHQPVGVVDSPRRTRWIGFLPGG
jgi:hypothetical protein